MQYFDFDFEKDKEFLNNSKVFNKILKNIEKDKSLERCDSVFKKSCVKLWGESVLKHNLSGDMGRIEYLSLISKENSKEVFKNIGKIIFKSKEKRTDEDYKKLRDQSLISISIYLIVIQQLNEKDICKELKAEFVEFKNSLTTKIVPKKAKI